MSDYTRLVARGLAARGDEVHVFAPSGSGHGTAEPGVWVHWLPDRFGVRTLLRLEGHLARISPDRLLVQYVPLAFGYKGMNLPFCAWLGRQRRHAVWTVFHEVALPLRPAQPWKHRLLAHAHRIMARLVVRASRRIFVSVPAWEPLLRSLAPRSPPMVWLPVPSNVPDEPDAGGVAAVRDKYSLSAGHVLLGHFGTFSPVEEPRLRAIFPALLTRDPGRVALFIGRGGPAFKGSLERAHPELCGRLLAPGELPGGEVANHLAACDLLLQPYHDGASSRRTTLMAGLALGLAVISAVGPLSDPWWRNCGAVAVPAGDTPADWLVTAERLLGEPGARAELGRRARALYRSVFHLDHLIDRLGADPACGVMV